MYRVNDYVERFFLLQSILYKYEKKKRSTIKVKKSRELMLTDKNSKISAIELFSLLNV